MAVELPYCIHHLIPDWKPGCGLCGACGEPITAKRRKWCCSKECTDRYLANHMWGYARDEAIRRAYMARWYPPLYLPRGNLMAYTWQFPLCAWLDGCDRTTFPYEVNHIEPRRGRGYGNGCHHHQANLEVLCRPHHVEVTKAQRVMA